MKHCTRCQNDKPKNQFYKAASKPDGLQTWCKICTKETQALSRKENPEKHSEWSKKSYYKNHANSKVRVKKNNAKWRQSNPDKVDKAYLDAKLKKYNLTLTEYENLLVKQDCKCAICKEPPSPDKSLVIDHNHETGQVRGLLCYRCNLAIGHLKDDPKLANSAAEYLSIHASHDC